jgi:uncharacterized protein YkwD
MKKALVFSVGSRSLNLRLRCIVVFFSLWLGTVSVLSQPAEGAEIADDIEQSIFLALNAYRVSKGRKPIATAGDDLVMAARAHAMDLLAMGQVGHVASTGKNFESRMRALRGGGVVLLPSMSENAARDRRKGVSNSAKALAIMQQWITSPRHRKSLTDKSYVAVAIGAVRKGDAVYAVQIFVGPETKNNLFN